MVLKGVVLLFLREYSSDVLYQHCNNADIFNMPTLCQ